MAIEWDGKTSESKEIERGKIFIKCVKSAKLVFHDAENDEWWQRYRRPSVQHAQALKKILKTSENN